MIEERVEPGRAGAGECRDDGRNGGGGLGSAGGEQVLEPRDRLAAPQFAERLRPGARRRRGGEPHVAGEAEEARISATETGQGDQGGVGHGTLAAEQRDDGLLGLGPADARQGAGGHDREVDRVGVCGTDGRRLERRPDRRNGPAVLQVPERRDGLDPNRQGRSRAHQGQERRGQFRVFADPEPPRRVRPHVGIRALKQPGESRGRRARAHAIQSVGDAPLQLRIRLLGEPLEIWDRGGLVEALERRDRESEVGPLRRPAAVGDLPEVPKEQSRFGRPAELPQRLHGAHPDPRRGIVERRRDLPRGSRIDLAAFGLERGAVFDLADAERGGGPDGSVFGAQPAVQPRQGPRVADAPERDGAPLAHLGMRRALELGGKEFVVAGRAAVLAL